MAAEKTKINLNKKYQVGWAAGQVLVADDREELHQYIDDLLDAGANPVVINIDITSGDTTIDNVTHLPTPIGG